MEKSGVIFNASWKDSLTLEDGDYNVEFTFQEEYDRAVELMNKISDTNFMELMRLRKEQLATLSESGIDFRIMENSMEDPAGEIRVLFSDRDQFNKAVMVLKDLEKKSKQSANQGIMGLLGEVHNLAGRLSSRIASKERDELKVNLTQSGLLTENEIRFIVSLRFANEIMEDSVNRGAPKYTDSDVLEARIEYALDLVYQAHFGDKLPSEDDWNALSQRENDARNKLEEPIIEKIRGSVMSLVKSHMGMFEAGKSVKGRAGTSIKSFNRK